jgi:ABC-type multidrug transport system ATPase subunit
MTEPLVQVDDVVRDYTLPREKLLEPPPRVQALKGVSLSIAPGMFGLLGPNGAGKTTLMKILATLLEPDSGTAEMNGIDLISDKHATRKMLGYLPQEFGLYPTLTAEQTLHYFAKLKGVYDKKERAKLVDALFDRVNLTDARRQRVGGFSGGMRQRLGIAQALIGQPQLIIVDEPTAGLDPEERIRFHNLLAETAGEDAVVILSTHIVADVSSLCSQMAVIRQGEILASITPQQAIDTLRRSKGLDVVVLVAGNGEVHAAWHGGARDSGRFSGWHAAWKSRAKIAQR